MSQSTITFTVTITPEGQVAPNAIGILDADDVLRLINVLNGLGAQYSTQVRRMLLEEKESANSAASNELAPEQGQV